MSFLIADKEQLRKSGIAQGGEFGDESVDSAEVEGAIAQGHSNTQVTDLIMLDAFETYLRSWPGKNVFV